MYTLIDGSWLNWVERAADNREILGSIPSDPIVTILSILFGDMECRLNEKIIMWVWKTQ